MTFFEPISPSGNGSKEEQVKEITQKIAKVFEKEVKKNPQDWHMLQRVWPDVLPLTRINQGLVN
jgi:KDO2-lipid IV(A) lauroyltransferase